MMSGISLIPQSVQAQTGAAQTTQYIAGWADGGISLGEDPTKSTLKENIDTLKKLVGNDPSLKQYLSTGIQALMAYDPPKVAANGGDKIHSGELPKDVVNESPDGSTAQADSDRIELGLRFKDDPTKGEMKAAIDRLKKFTDTNPDMRDYLDPTVDALLQYAK